MAASGTRTRITLYCVDTTGVEPATRSLQGILAPIGMSAHRGLTLRICVRCIRPAHRWHRIRCCPDPAGGFKPPTSLPASSCESGRSSQAELHGIPSTSASYHHSRPSCSLKITSPRHGPLQDPADHPVPQDRSDTIQQHLTQRTSQPLHTTSSVHDTQDRGSYHPTCRCAQRRSLSL